MFQHSPRLAETNQTTIEDALKLAHSHLCSRRLAEAELVYRQVLAIKPLDFEALHLSGVIAMQTGRLKQASALISRAIEQNLSSHAAHNNLGVALMHQGKLKEAAESFQRALSLKQDYAPAEVNLGRVQQKLGNHGIGAELTLRGTGFVRFTLARVQLVLKAVLIYMLDWFDILDWFDLADASCGFAQCLIGV